MDIERVIVEINELNDESLNCVLNSIPLNFILENVQKRVNVLEEFKDGICKIVVEDGK